MVVKIMTENRYINSDECRDDFYSFVLDILSDDCTNSRANEIIDAFDDLPTVDVAEIVRCKDCRYFRTSPEYCPKICSDEVHENFYCAYGSKCKTN